MNAAPTLLTVALSLPFAPSALGQVEVRLQPADPAAFGNFGISVAVDAERGVVGATGAATGGVTSGAAYVYDPSTGQQTMRLNVTDAESGGFGSAVALDGGRIYVGAPFRSDIGATPADFITRAGGVYVFDATSGAQLDFLLPSDAVPHANFARSLAVEGGLMAVGARAATAPGVEPDAVYVFDALTGQELHKLFASDGADEDGLGREVAIDGGLVLSGAAGDDDSGNRSGSAYVFDAVTSVELAKLTASDAAAGDAFGTSVAIEGNRAVVGAPRNEDNGPSSGSVYVFDARSGQELMKLVPADGLTGDTFGEAVAIEGGRILVGAPQSDELADRSGSVYVFDLATGAQLAKFTASDGGETHFFGSCLAAQRDVVAVGAPFADGSEPSEGAAYLFDLDGGPDGVVSYCEPTTPNAVSTTGALLTSTGGFGTSNATFNVSAVPNNFGLLFGGDAQTSVVLGCGTRCVGGAIVRGPIEMAVNNQVLGATFDMATFGSTDVQYWFRDAGSCGAGSNLSNALTR